MSVGKYVVFMALDLSVWDQIYYESVVSLTSRGQTGECVGVLAEWPGCFTTCEVITGISDY